MTRFIARHEDLGTVRFARSGLWETLHAVRLFADTRGRPYHEFWFRLVRERAGSLDLAPLLAVNPVRGEVPDFLSPPPRGPAPPFAAQVAEVRRTPPDQVAAELERCAATLGDTAARSRVDAMLADVVGARDTLAGLLERAWEVLVAPFWPTIEALLDADVVHRSRQLTDRGLQAMISGLHQRITWDGDAIVVDGGGDATVDLRGRGLVLMPSAFGWPQVVAVTDEPWQPTICYPARGIARLWQAPAPPPDALVRLLGRTRAMLLADLDRPASTTVLAARHGLSPSGVSRHLLALRDAGLAAGARHGHEIRYARTKLGTDLARAAIRLGPR